MALKNKKLYIIIAILVLLLIIWNLGTINNNSDFKLSNSKGNVSVRYTDRYKAVLSSNLVELDENDIWSNKDLNIIVGTIKNIKNIKLKVDGEVSYDALVSIEVKECIRGNIKVIDVLANCPINPKGIWQEDCMINSSLAKEDNGIFMIEENSDIIESGDSILQLSDIAKYIFPDAMHYCFIEKNDRIIYFESFYKELSDVENINEIKKYIKSKKK